MMITCRDTISDLLVFGSFHRPASEPIQPSMEFLVGKGKRDGVCNAMCFGHVLRFLAAA
jgi:hypothetical protein